MALHVPKVLIVLSRLMQTHLIFTVFSLFTVSHFKESLHFSPALGVMPRIEKRTYEPTVRCSSTKIAWPLKSHTLSDACGRWNKICLILERLYQYLTSGSCVSSIREVSLLPHTWLPSGNSFTSMVSEKSKRVKGDLIVYGGHTSWEWLSVASSCGRDPWSNKALFLPQTHSTPFWPCFAALATLTCIKTSRPLLPPFSSPSPHTYICYFNFSRSRWGIRDLILSRCFKICTALVPPTEITEINAALRAGMFPKAAHLTMQRLDK